MNELIAQVTQKAGISTDQASKAVQTVMSFLKEKLPAGLGSQLEGLLGGGGGGGDLAGDAMKKIGGLFGK